MIAILTPVLAVAFVIWLQRASRVAARMVGDFTVVEYPAPARALGIVACGLIAVFMIRIYSAGYPLQLLLVVLVIGIVAVLMALSWGLTQISFDKDHIRTFSIWRGRRMIPWKDLRELSSGLSGWTVHTAGHGGIRFNHLQRGWQEFREAVRSNLTGVAADRT